jgi:hypothetical protein
VVTGLEMRRHQVRASAWHDDVSTDTGNALSSAARFRPEQPLDFVRAVSIYRYADCLGAAPAIHTIIKKGNVMKVAEEFNVKNAAGKILPLQYITPQLTYLDFGSVRLPRNFEGYRVKDSTKVAEKLSDGSFRIAGSDEVYTRC